MVARTCLTSRWRRLWWRTAASSEWSPVVRRHAAAWSSVTLRTLRNGARKSDRWDDLCILCFYILVGWRLVTSSRALCSLSKRSSFLLLARYNSVQCPRASYVLCRSPLSHLQFFDITWRLDCSRTPSQINCLSERLMLRDSVYFTTLKSLDYNVMTFRFNNNNNNNMCRLCWLRL